MIEKLKKHIKWRMSTKHFYGKYMYRIQMGPFTQRFNIVSGLANYRKIDYRQRWDWAYNFSWQNPGDARFNISIYTNDETLVDYLISNFNDKIKQVESPLNEKHSEILDNLGANTKFRKQLYYNRYPFKLEAWRSYRNTDATDDDVKEAYQWILDNFDTDLHSRVTIRSRIASDHWSWTKINSIGNYNWGQVPSQSQSYGRYVELPLVYTQDEPSLMMFKLMYGNKLDMEITRVVTL